LSFLSSVYRYMPINEYQNTKLNSTLSSNSLLSERHAKYMEKTNKIGN